MGMRFLGFWFRQLTNLVIYSFRDATTEWIALSKSQVVAQRRDLHQRLVTTQNRIKTNGPSLLVLLDCLIYGVFMVAIGSDSTHPRSSITRLEGIPELSRRTHPGPLIGYDPSPAI